MQTCKLLSQARLEGIACNQMCSLGKRIGKGMVLNSICNSTSHSSRTSACACVERTSIAALPHIVTVFVLALKCSLAPLRSMTVNGLPDT